MQTTVIIVELLVIGGGVALLLLPLVALLLGTSVTDLATGIDLADFLIVAVCAVYPIGIVWSRICDLMSSPLDRRLIATVFAKDGRDGVEGRKAYENALIHVHILAADLAASLAQYRALFRVARATCFVSFIGAFWIPVALAREPGFALSRAGMILIGALTFGLSIGAGASWLHLRKTYLWWVKTANEILMSPTGPFAQRTATSRVDD